MYLSDNLQIAPLNITNLPVGGNIGAAIATVDVYQTFWLAQTTAGQTVSLPAPTVANTAYTAVVSVVGSAGVVMYGVTIPSGYSHTFQWTGTNWVPAAAPNSQTGGSITVPVVVASGTVNLGDPIPVGARPVSNIFNLASAAGLDGSTSDARFSVTFSTIVASANYVIQGSLRSNVATSWNNDNDIIWQVVSKSTTGFVIAVKELASIAQDVSFDFQCLNQTLVTGAVQTPVVAGNIIAMTPFNAPVESVVTFDGFNIKWHDATAASFDGIAISTVSGTRDITYDSTEWFVAASAADSGKSLWGSENVYYNIPTGGGTATLNAASAYPHLFPLSAIYVGMGNPALPNTDVRLYNLYDHTNFAHYRIFIHKNGPQGEVFTSQTGRCSIVVERIGVTPLAPLSAGSGISITSGVISSNATVPVVRIFTASGTYTPTVGMKYVIATIIGSGGGGAGAGAGSVATIGFGTGGGAGGEAEVLLTAAQIGASQAVTIGTAGAVTAARVTVLG